MIGSSGSLIDYGGYYFPFVILGVASLDFCVSIINSINNSIRDDQISGVLEEIYIIDNNYYKYVLSLSVYPLIFNIIKFNVYIFCIIFWFTDFIYKFFKYLSYFYFDVFCTSWPLFNYNLLYLNFLKRVIFLIVFLYLFLAYLVESYIQFLYCQILFLKPQCFYHPIT